MATFDKTLPVFKDWTEGPFGVPMPDKLAIALAEMVKAHPSGPEFEYRQAAGVVKYSNEIRDGERADISILATPTVDRDREVVSPAGIDLKQFRANPIVTFGHRYDQYPIGKAAWIRYDGDWDALKAKTVYEAKPDNWAGDWAPDAVFSMVKSGTLRGKSIGFKPVKGHAPTGPEIKQHPELANAKWIFDEVILLEYSVVPIPANPDALVELIGKGEVTADVLKMLGIDVPPPAPVKVAPPPVVKPVALSLPKHVLSESQLRAAIRASLAKRLNVDRIVGDALHLARGGV